MPDQRRLNITGCRQVHSGIGNNGKPYEIYEVDATTEQGLVVNLPLRSFSNLPMGVNTFNVAPYTNNRGETSYTLSLPQQRGGGVNPQVLAAMQENIQSLQTRVTSLEQQLGLLQAPRTTQGNQYGEPPTPVPTTPDVGDDPAWGAPSAAPPPGDDDIPF